MLLSQLLKNVSYQRHQWHDVDITSIAFDSREVTAGSLFVAQRGTQVDGHVYIPQAVSAGAAAIVCEKLPETNDPSVVYICCDDSSEALGLIAAAFYGFPSSKMKLVGITGTNGKTTTATLLHRMMRIQGIHAGLISTIVNKIDDEEIATSHTTPDAISLNRLLARMVADRCTYCFMEVSSHAIVQRRIAGLHFAGAVFSNITHDHLDFHHTMAAYIAAKKQLFDSLPNTAFALTNIDDRNGTVMVQNCKAKVYTYSLRTVADFRCKIVEESFQGMQLQLDGQAVDTPLIGRFNAYNLTAIYATALLCGTERNMTLQLLSQLHPAPGRFAVTHGSQKIAIVDYAHTPDALLNVISTINDIRKKTQHLITVVGCGGDRDHTKRPEMARIAVEGSSQVILTSDNPRTENPEHILDDMEAGLSPSQLEKTLRITDRRSALRTAARLALPGDIILVAGKGHETYQEINGVKQHFDDMEEIDKILANN